MTKRWYVIHTYSGSEGRVKTSLEERSQALGLREQIAQILLPTEDMVEIKGGKKKISPRKIFPGYLMIEMDMTEETWYLIKNTPKVTGFLGDAKHPTPLPDEEVQHLLEQLRGDRTKAKPRVLFARGELVRIIDGPFTNFSGVIEEINPDRGKVKVMVTIFGRATPVELEFVQIEVA